MPFFYHDYVLDGGKKSKKLTKMKRELAIKCEAGKFLG